jgi:hypothetical protein
MDVFLTDLQIQELISLQKQMSIDPDSLFSGMREKKGHKGAEHEMPQSDGSSFVIKVRVSIENPMDFSVILGYSPVSTTKLFLLRRYNGRSHEHKNRMESAEVFYDYHIHQATERYQREGSKEEYYAEKTGRYSTPREALNCLIADCNISLPPESQLKLGL